MFHPFLYLLPAILATATLTCSATSLLDQSSTKHDVGYYQRHAEGWYWYKDPEQEEKPRDLPVDPHQQDQSSSQKEETQNRPETQNSVTPLSAKWVREMLPRYRDLMWSEPTPQNVKAYFLLQRFAIDRSQKVAEVAQQVTLGNPLLDETFRRPTASFGVNAIDRNAGKHTDEVLSSIAQKAGLFFFFKSDCQFCEAQAPLVSMLEEEYGFDVLAISIDGGTLESKNFKNTRIDAGHAQMLGVTATPALFLVSSDGKFESLGQGLMALPDLRRRIVIAALRQGWIEDKEFDATKPIINPESQIDLSNELPRLLLAAQNPAMAWGSSEATAAASETPESVKRALMDSDGFIQPADLLSIFNGAGTSGTFNPLTISHQNHEEKQN